MAAEEKKTRVLPRGASGQRRGSAAADEGGKVVFHCPNGHRIVAKPDLAGRRGKCSKCQADVTIPGPSGKPSDAASPAFVFPGVASAEARPAGDEVMPDIQVSPPPPPPPPPSQAATGQAAGGEEETWGFIAEQAEPPPAQSSGETVWPSAGQADGLDVGGGNTTSQLVARLWAEREHGGIIELHLEGGSVILPEWYDAAWSRGTHGLFASQAADGSVTLTAVAWDTVRKIVVRQLAEVPDDMFP